jgi:hypothetical protein
LEGFGLREAGSSPLLDGAAVGTHRSELYLKSLLGGEPEDSLREGRIGLLFCGYCLDSSDGHLVAADLDLGPESVTWSAIGFETENFGEFEKGFPRRRQKVIPPDEWWTPAPVEPEIVIRFERENYVRSVEAELERTLRQGRPS